MFISFNEWLLHKLAENGVQHIAGVGPSAGQVSLGNKMAGQADQRKKNFLTVVHRYFGRQIAPAMMPNIHADLSDFVNRVGPDTYKDMLQAGVAVQDGQRVRFRF